MSNLKKGDFYYGAFLSALLNKPNANPSLFDSENNDSRRIYKFATNNTAKSDYIVYVKYVNGVKKEKFTHWIFSFNNDEIEKLQNIKANNTDVYVALVCAKKDFKDCEIALLDYDEASDCLGIEKITQAFRINIKSIKNRPGLFSYGSGRADTKNGKENYINIQRDRLAEL